MKEYICKEYIAKDDLIQKHTKFLAGYHRGVDLPQGMTKELYDMIDLPTVTDADICREFKLEVLKCIEIGIEATGHTDQYLTGFCNGLIWLRSCITGEEPEFLAVLAEREN